MWLFIKSLFMIKDQRIGMELVEQSQHKIKFHGFKLSRLLRRRARRKKFKAHNTTNLTYKVK